MYIQSFLNKKALGILDEAVLDYLSLTEVLARQAFPDSDQAAV